MSSLAPSSLLLPGLIAIALLLPGWAAHALPAAGYQVDLISEPGKTSTSVRGVDATGRALGYWSFFSQPPPRPPFSEPDDEGYFMWENGTRTPFAIPGLTGVVIVKMNVAGAMWGASDQGWFAYVDGELSVLHSPDADVTVIQGVDAENRVYGFLGNYLEGADLNDPLTPIFPDSSFVWETGTFTDLEVLAPGAWLTGVRQDGVFWGKAGQNSFIQDGASLTILDHPNFDGTTIRMLTADSEVLGLGLTTDPFDSIDFFWDPLGGYQDWPDEETLPGTTVRGTVLSEAGVFWGRAGSNTAFIATPLSEPSTALLVGLGVALALRRRSRAAI